MKNRFCSVFILLIVLVLQACGQSRGVVALDAQQFEDSLKDINTQLVDVRTLEEYNGGFIQYASNIDWNSREFESNISKLDKTKPLYLYCLSGGRSGKAAAKCIKMGFTQVYHLDGGIMEWKYQNKNVVTPRPDQVKGMSMDQYNQLVTQDKPVLVEFFAPWCGPCKTLKPNVEAIGKEYSDRLNVVFIDVDKNNLISDSLNIRSIPLLLYYKNGKLEGSWTGTFTKRELISKLGL
jgi:thioredoxin